MRPILSGFAQVAYATNDIAYAMDLYDKKYGISSFYQLDAQMPARVRGDEGVVSLKVGLANVAGVQIELMEPLSDLDGFFGSDLAEKSGFTLALHHFLQLVDGDLADWDAHVRAAIPDAHDPGHAVVAPASACGSRAPLASRAGTRDVRALR